MKTSGCPSSCCDGSGESLRGVRDAGDAPSSSWRGVRVDIVSERGDDNEPNIAERMLWAGAFLVGD